jgi:hypothetical protein
VPKLNHWDECDLENLNFHLRGRHRLFGQHGTMKRIFTVLCLIRFKCLKKIIKKLLKEKLEIDTLR